jgi:hypothetical protein
MPHRCNGAVAAVRSKWIFKTAKAHYAGGRELQNKTIDDGAFKSIVAGRDLDALLDRHRHRRDLH